MIEPKKVICYRGDRAACWFYRLHAPMIYFAKNNEKTVKITVSSTINKDHLNQFDIVILQRQYKYDVLAPVLEMQKNGAKLIYEIDDDLFHIPAWNPAAKILGVKKVQDGIKHFLARVDALFVTTEQLAKVYSDYCKRVYVLPNSIDYDVVYNYPSNNVLPVVCWQGSMTHEKDLEIARAGFARIAQDKDLIFKMWCGYESMVTRKPVFDIPGTQVLPLVQFEAFFQMFSQVGVTIGLAPLAANSFNKGKSNLKFLEYTAQGAVTVASNFGPYKDTIEHMETGILIDDNRNWYDSVRFLLDNPDQRKRILENAQEFVKENYDVSKNYIYWEDAIKEIGEF